MVLISATSGSEDMTLLPDGKIIITSVSLKIANIDVCEKQPQGPKIFLHVYLLKTVSTHDLRPYNYGVPVNRF